MSRVVKTTLPWIILVIVTLAIWANYFYVEPTLKSGASELASWAVIIAAGTLIAGIANLFIAHGNTIRKPPKPESVITSAILLVSMIAMIVIGQGLGLAHPAYTWAYNYIFYALWVVMWSFAGFYLFTVSYRAFRVRNVEMLLFTVGAVLVMMRLFPLADLIHPDQSMLGTWIYNVPTAGSMRAIMISTAVGFLALGLRMLLGREKKHFGG